MILAERCGRCWTTWWKHLRSYKDALARNWIRIGY